jgi:energy-converting hydrogenase Eha subunit G
MLKKFFKIFVPAVYSGLCIGIGGMVYLNCENKVVGAFMLSDSLQFYYLGLISTLARLDISVRTSRLI